MASGPEAQGLASSGSGAGSVQLDTGCVGGGNKSGICMREAGPSTSPGRSLNCENWDKL